MPAINQQVASLDKIETGSVVGADFFVLDADDTVFPHGKDQPHPDFEQFLEVVMAGSQLPRLAIVSANPDPHLAERRRQAIGAEFMAHPNFANPDKRGLVQYVVRQAVEIRPIETAMVIGNRWLLDVVIPRAVLIRMGIPNFGVHIRRHDAHLSAIDTHVLDPIERIASRVCKLLKVDHHVRPPHD